MFGNAMKDIAKLVAASTKTLTSENKLQSALLGDVMKTLGKSASGASGATAKALKDITAALQKAAKLGEAQTSLLDGVKPDDLAGDDGDEGADQAKELEDAVKRITDENKKQATEIDKLLADVDKAAKEAGDDKGAGKKIKAATAALEKAVKLIDEQSKLLEEAKKALAG